MLEEKNKSVMLTMQDDGVGIDPDQKVQGIGLKNIRSRIEFKNGSMQLKTSPLRGCTMVIDLPV